MQQTHIDPVFKFTTHQSNQSDDYKSYSFGEEIYNEFLKRSQKIQKIQGLKKQKYHLVGTIKGDEQQGVYTIHTSVGFESPLCKEILKTVEYLNDISENPEKILRNLNYSQEFEQSAKKLKSKGFNIKEIYSYKNELWKTYKYSEYLLYKSEQELIYHHMKKTEPTKIKITDLQKTLINLNRQGIIKKDDLKITEMKKEIKPSKKSENSQKGIDYFRKISKQGTSVKNTHNEITTKTEFDKLITLLDTEKILKYFPFKSQINTGFIKKILINKFGTSPNFELNT